MNPDRLSQPIKAESLEEHERKLEFRMNEIKLEYVDRLYSKRIPMLEDEDKKGVSADDFGSLLIRYTPILRDLIKFYVAQRKREGVEWDPTMYDLVQKEFEDKIVEFHRTGEKNWIEKTMGLYVKEKEKFEEILKINSGSPGEEQNHKEKKVAGIINFDVEDVNNDYPKELSGLVKKGDTCVSIHLESLFKNGNRTKATMSSSLAELAVKIIEDFPYTVAIVARSWIMDTPISKRMGFTEHERQKYDNNDSFWGQFMNSNGQIDDDRVKTFLETGEAPFEIVTSVMKVEDFLRKYLPKERKGKIKLRDLNPNFDVESFYQETEIVRNRLRDKWDDLDKEGIAQVFVQCPLIQRFNESDYGRGFFDLLFKLKSEGKTKAQFEVDENLLSYKNFFEKFVVSIKYVEREVTIE